MPLLTIGGSRQAPYDRNALGVTSGYNGLNIAPHGLTVRVSYTVPTARKAFVENIEVRGRRVTAAAPVGVWAPSVNFIPNGGGGVSLVYLRTTKNAVDDTVERSLAGYGTLYAGDQLILKTEDASTGGTVDYVASCRVTEFDA